MTSELAERLRGANPVPATDAVVPDESLLSQIVATPRPSAVRFSRRRGVTLLAAAIIVIGGIAAAASRFAPYYFGSDDREPTPAAVMAELRDIARWAPPGERGEVDPTHIVRLASFETESGRATIFAAPMQGRSGFCEVHTLGEEISGGGCDDEPTKAVPYMAHGASEWGDIRVLQGRLEGPAARIDVRFEDGAVRATSIRAPLWVYVVGGDELEPGRRPVGLVALDPRGAVVATQEFEPYYFTSEAAAEALLPESDGSPGQNAIRVMLEGLGSIEPVLPIEIDRTRLLRRIETPEGTLDIYTAPWRNGVCFALSHSRLSVDGTGGCPNEDESHPNLRATFEVEPSFIGPVRPSIFTIHGTPPAAAVRVEVSFEDGTSARADIFVPSFFQAWFGPERLVAGRRPMELVAFDGNGRELATFPLDPEVFRPCRGELSECDAESR